MLQPSRSYALAALLRNGGLYGAALLSVPLLARAAVWAPLLAMPVLGLAMYRLTMVMHECVHGTLFASRRANRIVGAAVGALSGIEFHAFARLHWRHHRRTGESDDPQGFDYLLPPSASRGAILWHLLRPLFGYNVFKLYQVYGALDRLGRARGGGTLRSRQAALVVCVQAAAAIIASDGFAAWWLLPLPAVSATTFGLFFSQLRGFAEHVALPGDDPCGFVRSHRANLIDRLLLYDLNFNLHREHHRHPAVPSCRLPELRLLLPRSPGAAAAEGPCGTMFGTIRRRLSAAGKARRAEVPA